MTTANDGTDFSFDKSRHIGDQEIELYYRCNKIKLCRYVSRPNIATELCPIETRIFVKRQNKHIYDIVYTNRNYIRDVDL